MSQTKIGQRLQAYTAPGSMGVVKNIRFIRCYWPSLDRPTLLFAAGSSGISVLGTTRNVLFPPDTVFEKYFPDALYPAELAVLAMSPGRRGLINLADDECKCWCEAYEKATLELFASNPATAMHETNIGVLFLRERIGNDVYIADLTMGEADSLVNGLIKEMDLRARKQFRNAATDEPRGRF